MVDMFNDNQLFDSEIDTGRSGSNPSKDGTALEDIAGQIAADIEKVEEHESNNRVFEYEPAQLQQEL